MIRIARAVVVLRHNTELGGDLRLAMREFASLMGAEGALLGSRRELAAALGGLRIAAMVELSKNDSMVAMLWHNAPLDGIIRVLRRSAFAQEVVVLDAESERVSVFEREWAGPCARIQELTGFAAVALSASYVIESEGVLDDTRAQGRVRRTIDLLLHPYLDTAPSPNSLKLRRAKKTTLSLSHDLHIYKAKFFPRMVRALLNLFSADRTLVFDPFCGSGTALLEASLLGLDSVGIDIDPICQMIGRTKMGPFLDASALSHALDVFERELNRAPPNSSNFNFPAELTAKIARRDKIDGTNFLPEIQAEAAVLAGALRAANIEGLAGDLLKVLASDAVTKKIRYRFVGVGNGKYTIEIVKQRLLDRLSNKIQRSRQLASVFQDLRVHLGINLGKIDVAAGDARDPKTWPFSGHPATIITSPPYLPASSGREHYAASRALAFAILGYAPGAHGYYNMNGPSSREPVDLRAFPEAAKLMDYLASDSAEDADPQRDAMRFERKAAATGQYIADMGLFFRAAQSGIGDSAAMLFVVAHHHTFYSHRRQELEHIVSGRDLYSEIARPAGVVMEEEIEMKLLKAAISRARPRAKDDYFESVLVFKSGAAATRLREGTSGQVIAGRYSAGA